MRCHAIIIPTFDRFEYVTWAITSCLNQIIPESWKLIIVVVDDGSSDRTFERLGEQFGEPIKQGKVFVLSKPNGERGAARNFGAQFAIDQQVDWLQFLDADDILAPQSLAEVLAEIDEEILMVGAKYRVWDGHDPASQKMEPPSRNLDQRMGDLFGSSNPLALGATLIRASLFAKIKFFEDRALSGSEDYVFLWMLTFQCAGHIKIMDKCLVWYRRHLNNTPVEKTRRAVVLAEKYLEPLVEKKFQNPKRKKRELWLYHRFCLVGACHSQLDYNGAIRELFSILRARPFQFFNFYFLKFFISTFTKKFARLWTHAQYL